MEWRFQILLLRLIFFMFPTFSFDSIPVPDPAKSPDLPDTKITLPPPTPADDVSLKVYSPPVRLAGGWVMGGGHSHIYILYSKTCAFGGRCQRGVIMSRRFQQPPPWEVTPRQTVGRPSQQLLTRVAHHAPQSVLEIASICLVVACLHPMLRELLSGGQRKKQKHNRYCN